MNITSSGPAGVGAAAAPALEPQAQPHAALAPPATAAAAEDKVTISAAAQELPQPMSVQVVDLHNQGQSVPQIATQLSISPSAVQSYLGVPPPGTKA